MLFWFSCFCKWLVIIEVSSSSCWWFAASNIEVWLKNAKCYPCMVCGLMAIWKMFLLHMPWLFLCLIYWYSIYTSFNSAWVKCVLSRSQARIKKRRVEGGKMPPLKTCIWRVVWRKWCTIHSLKMVFGVHDFCRWELWVSDYLERYCNLLLLFFLVYTFCC